MGKNLFRNGGFERGDVKFWDAADHTSFAVDTVIKRKGTYSGKIYAQAAAKPYITCSDFIPISEGEAYVLEGYVYPLTWFTLTPIALFYDESLSLIETRGLMAQTVGTTQWTRFLEVITYHRGADYVKVSLKQENMGIGEYSCWDSLSLNKMDPQEMVGDIEELFPSTAVEGADTTSGDMFPALGYHEAVFILNVTAKDNDTGTFDAVIQSFDRGNNGWIDIATFNQVTTVLGRQVLVVTAGIGEIVRMQVVTGGTEPGYTFTGSVIFKR